MTQKAPFTLVTDNKTDDSAQKMEKEETDVRDEKEEQGADRSFLRCVRNFAQDTSIHGVRCALDRKSGRLSRVLWGLLVVGAVVTLMMMLWELYASYQSRPVKTILSVTPSDTLPFPALTVCNVNGLEVDKLRQLDTTTQNVSAVVTSLFLVSSILKDHVNDTLALIESRLSAEVLNQTFQDIVQASYADLNTTFVWCSWNGQEENCHNMFRTVDVDARRCFIFNGPSESRRVSRTSGMTSGLALLINVRQEEYLFNDVLNAGVQVILHEPDQIPDIDRKGFMAAPGFSTISKVLLTKYQYLPSPFRAFGSEACVDNAALPSQEMKVQGRNFTYSLALCHKMCIEGRTQQACGCRLNDHSFTHLPSLPLCTLREVFSCYKQKAFEVSLQLNETVCPCPRPCRRTEYQDTTSISYFPSDIALVVLQNLGLVSSQEAGRKNLLELKVFYDDLVMHEISHVPEHTIDSILGTMGGQMGLFLGASLLSVIELLLLVCELCQQAVCVLWSRLHPHCEVIPVKSKSP